jgi:hypothetical protein
MLRAAAALAALLALARCAAPAAASDAAFLENLLAGKPQLTAAQARAVEGAWDYVSGRRIEGATADLAFLAATGAARTGRLPDFAPAAAAAAANSTAVVVLLQISIVYVDPASGEFLGYRLVTSTPQEEGGWDMDEGRRARRLLGTAQPAPGGGVLLRATNDQDSGVWSMLVRGDMMAAVLEEGDEVWDREAKTLYDDQTAFAMTLKRAPYAARLKALRIIRGLLPLKINRDPAYPEAWLLGRGPAGKAARG